MKLSLQRISVRRAGSNLIPGFTVSAATGNQLHLGICSKCQSRYRLQRRWKSEISIKQHYRYEISIEERQRRADAAAAAERLVAQMSVYTTDDLSPNHSRILRLTSSHQPDPLHRAVKRQRSMADEDFPAYFQTMMRFMTHPVVVLTTSLSADPSTWKGITLSSFNSLSIPKEPQEKPLISFNIKIPSSFSRTLQESQSFLLHVMLPTKQGAMVAERFASPVKEDAKFSEDIAEKIIGKHLDIPGYTGALGRAINISDKSDATSIQKPSLPFVSQLEEGKPLPFTLSRGQFSSIPLLLTQSTNHPKIAESSIFVLHCSPHVKFPIKVSDHELWVAHVKSIDYNPKSWTGLPHSNIYDTENNLPLVLTYGDRMFRQPGLSLAKGFDDARRMVERKLVYEREVELTKRLEGMDTADAGDFVKQRMKQRVEKEKEKGKKEREKRDAKIQEEEKWEKENVGQVVFEEDEEESSKLQSKMDKEMNKWVERGMERKQKAEQIKQTGDATDEKKSWRRVFIPGEWE